MLDWLWFALAAAFLIALTDIADKILLGKFVRSVRAYTVFSGIVQLALGLALLSSVSFAVNAPPHVVALLVFSALLVTATYYLFYASVAVGEVGRLVPILYSYPLFALVLAFTFLGERISLAQALGALLIVAGAAAASIEKSSASKRVGLQRGAALMFGVAVLYALISVIEKYVLGFVSAQVVIGFNGVLMGVLVVSTLALRGTREEFKKVVAQPKIMLVTLANESIVFVGYLCAALALSMTLASLAAPISAVRPLFVFALAALASVAAPKLFKEPLDAKTVAVKFAGVVLVVAGAALIIT